MDRHTSIYDGMIHSYHMPDKEAQTTSDEQLRIGSHGPDVHGKSRAAYQLPTLTLTTTAHLVRSGH